MTSLDPTSSIADPGSASQTPVSDTTISSLQRIGMGVWSVLVATGVIVAFGWPHLLEPTLLHGWFASARVWMVPLFVVACVLRVAFFVPASTMLLTGLLFMPPVEALVFTTLGFIAATLGVYYGARHLGFAVIFARRYPVATESVRAALQRHGAKIVMAWAFLPVVPTDAISAVAGVTRMSLPRFLFAVTAGQTILAVPLAFGGGALLRQLFA